MNAYEREAVLADRADAMNDQIACGEDPRTGAYTHWRCCKCYQDCLISESTVGPLSKCCKAACYNADVITNRDDTASTTARLRVMREIESGADSPTNASGAAPPPTVARSTGAASLAAVHVASVRVRPKLLDALEEASKAEGLSNAARLELGALFVSLACQEMIGRKV